MIRDTEDGFRNIVFDVLKENLKLSEILGNDNFFELGGTSIQAIHVVCEIEALSGVTIPVDFLFETDDLDAFIAAAVGFSLQTPTA